MCAVVVVACEMCVAVVACAVNKDWSANILLFLLLSFPDISGCRTCIASVVPHKPQTCLEHGIRLAA